MTTSFLQYDQVFVILRFDPTASGEGAPETGVGVLKALWSQAAAEAEVARLNQSTHELETRYFWKAARLERRRVEAGTP